MIENTCCFFGHREITESEKLREKLTETVEKLITDEGVDTFLFGSNSRFDKLCLELVTKIKEKYPHVKRIYVRAEYPYISDSYEKYLLESYDETYFPEKLLGAGKAAYVERNREMIDKSRFCVVYYDENYVPKVREGRKNDMLNLPRTRKSGTKLALDYVVKKDRVIYIFPKT